MAKHGKLNRDSISDMRRKIEKDTDCILVDSYATTGGGVDLYYDLMSEIFISVGIGDSYGGEEAIIYEETYIIDAFKELIRDGEESFWASHWEWIKKNALPEVMLIHTKEESKVIQQVINKMMSLGK